MPAPSFPSPGTQGTQAPSPPEPGEATRTILATVLLLLTFVSVTLAGALHGGAALDGTPGWPLVFAGTSFMASGLSFSLPLCAILVCHELGHYLVARHHRVPVSLPYFIPFPFSEIGTLGAIIGLRRQIRSRDVLFDVAAAGPVAGLVCTLPVLCVGLSLSRVVPVAPGDGIEGQSLLYLLLKYVMKGSLLPRLSGGQVLDVSLHPAAFAGWVGLLVTMINLLPIGQLDGGRLAAAYFGENHARRGTVLFRCLFVVAALCTGYVAWQARHGAGPVPSAGRALFIGVQAALPWLFWAGMLLLMRRFSGGVWHPEVDRQPLSPGRRALCVGLLVLLGLLFMPYVIREST